MDPQPVIVTVLDNVILTKLVCYHESVPNVYEPYYESRINFDRKGETNTAATIMRSEPMYESVSRSGAVSSVGGSCFVAGAGRRRRFVALRPRARV